jgi:hypothetical protein
MASLIPGFEYDIFISYRQKDNKGDRWVSEFVDNLKTELESTFKEEISVYFDINPEDGLLETHDVDASLREKLKCLVFIPIMSHTYCDPKSFAWKNEFEAFIEQASKDQYGLKILLNNGNVASRILPIRIHDLSADDIRTVERTMGAIRSIDFIYRSKGVNRPLRTFDDEIIKATNQSLYRDQINKMANAIYEILSNLKRMYTAFAGEKILITEHSSPDILDETNTFFEYNGPVDTNIINLLLNKLKVQDDFEALNRTTANRVYSIVAEWLENISRYSYNQNNGGEITQPHVSIKKLPDQIIIKAGNPIANDKLNPLLTRLKEINEVNEDKLRKMYTERITSDVIKKDEGMELGFILTLLKSNNRIEYKITNINELYSYFDIQVKINKFIGNKLIIEETTNSPKVHFDPSNYVFEISGESRPMDVHGFYSSILKWLDEFARDLMKSHEIRIPIEFNLNFKYFNSTSLKYILDFCSKLANLKSNGKDVVINWYYDKYDTDMLESGKELSRLANIQFEYILKE